MYLIVPSGVFSASSQSHSDLIGGIWWSIFTDEALCWHGHFTEHKNTSHEAHASGSLCSLGVSAHWFVIIGRLPLTRWMLIGALYCSVEPTDEAPIVVKTKMLMREKLTVQNLWTALRVGYFCKSQRDGILIKMWLLFPVVLVQQYLPAGFPSGVMTLHSFYCQ